ncbi:hypothetical protein [Neolewinella antarctica]|uniref:Uncharacterized protein n=1 Tax=Neolewinella antarctica TaxID=442734 RepID=A0ABX0X7I0_9BACT|nr:hypothetical protein [Neolewinella antarctica]NJC24782.1 hypothetical protein [Neolewinella antarctica]
MTTQEKADIHELLSAFRIGPAIERLAPHVTLLPRPRQENLSLQLAKLRGRNEHFNNVRKADHTPTDRRRENDDLVKALQLILSQFEINDKPRSLADIIGRDLDDDFLEREKEKQASPDATTSDKGFHEKVIYVGSPSVKQATVTVGKSYGATYHKCTQTLRRFNVAIERGDRDGGQIVGVTTGNSQARFGEKVLVWVTPKPLGKTEITVVVDSNLRDTVLDMGRHQQLLDKLTHAIQYD